MVHEVQSIRLERATISFHGGRPLSFPSAGLYVPVNSRGILAAGTAAEVRLAGGPDVEQGLRQQVPLSVGNAYLIGPGKLIERGIEVIAFGVAVRDPGDMPRIGVPEQALKRGLELLEDRSIRAITIPLVNRQMEERHPGDNARNLARHLAAHLRQRSNFRQVKVTGLDEGYLRVLRSELVHLGGSSET